MAVGKPKLLDEVRNRIRFQALLHPPPEQCYVDWGERSPEQGMVQDLITIVHGFSSRLYDLRNFRKKLLLENFTSRTIDFSEDRCSDRAQ